ncbi:FixH family protein [Metabacillus litoralis]|uniref:FixH family protein n=1 Tax=Metabacillus litoralis TaxID=152268 RepID=UPI00203F8C3D|nr:FixH family protein [Metabacillus litoralis]MCM3650847.1 FixH family protein [Metabacillus litoralis]
MKNKMVAYSFLIFMFILSGCQESNNQIGPQTTEEEVKAPRVEIMAEDHVNKNEDVQIAAHVYYGEELVDDAEVTFEIKLGEESEEVEAKLVDTGTYKIDYSFKEDGTYQVIAHTDVKSYHTMPKMEILVGEADSGATVREEHDGEHGHANHAEGDHHSSSVNITLGELTGIQAKTKVQLTATVQENNQPFSQAMVRFEIWKDGEEHHHYIDAAESTAKGTYISDYQFKEEGMYKIVVHVEREEVHDHIETSIDVQ